VPSRRPGPIPQPVVDALEVHRGGDQDVAQVRLRVPDVAAETYAAVLDRVAHVRPHDAPTRPTSD